MAHRFVRDNEPVIQGEAHFQYMNEAKENNIIFADDYEALSENYAEIQQDTVEEQGILNLDCNAGSALEYVERQDEGWDITCYHVSTFQEDISLVYY